MYPGFNNHEKEMTNTMELLNKAWADGYRAFCKGDLESSNPFDPASKEFEFWSDGWTDGLDDEAQR